MLESGGNMQKDMGDPLAGQARAAAGTATGRAQHRLGFLFVTGSAIAWSLGGVFTRVIHVDSWTMVAWRGLFGAASIAAVLMVTGERAWWTRLKAMRPVGWLFIVQSALGMVCYLTALRHTTVANVAVIYATAPFLAAALGWWVMRERPTRSSIGASLAALAGVAVMVGVDGRGGWVGDLLAFVMTLSMATATVGARNFPDLPIALTACLSSLLSAACAWPLGSPLEVSHRDLALLALFGIVNFGLGLPLFVLGARRLPAIETALIGAVDAPLAPLWVWLAFNETPATGTLIGGGIVFAAVGVHLSLR
jgi:drug/metabolite transporter (DMT)-like permease